jgi:hypothetical protein
MAAIAATSYATPTAQAWQGRARLDQVRREADQAEANARQLRAQADQAEQQAQQGQNKVRSVSAQLAQQDSTYNTQLRRQLSSTELRQVQGLLTPVTAVSGQAASFPKLAPTLPPKPWADVNQRPSSGRLVNLTV